MEEKNKYDRAIEAIDNFVAAMKAVGLFGFDMDDKIEELKEMVRFAEFREQKDAPTIADRFGVGPHG